MIYEQLAHSIPKYKCIKIFMGLILDPQRLKVIPRHCCTVRYAQMARDSCSSQDVRTKLGCHRLHRGPSQCEANLGPGRDKGCYWLDLTGTEASPHHSIRCLRTQLEPGLPDT